jgi:ABC-type sugar transport system ATPase subunit
MISKANSAKIRNPKQTQMFKIRMTKTREDTVYLRFVATFIGSPEMNFFKGRVTIEGGRCVFRGTGFSLDLGKRGINSVEEEAELGIRPEDMEIHHEGRTPLQTRVELVTNMGSEVFVHARLGEEVINVRAPKDTSLRPGDMVSLSVAAEGVHIFLRGQRI